VTEPKEFNGKHHGELVAMILKLRDKRDKLAGFAKYVISIAPEEDPTDEEIEEADGPADAMTVAVSSELFALAAHAREALGVDEKRYGHERAGHEDQC
jgi:hypothetical protein